MTNADTARTARTARITARRNFDSRENSGDVVADLIADKGDLLDALDAAERELEALRAMLRKNGIDGWR
jgi:hypothetical protein